MNALRTREIQIADRLTPIFAGRTGYTGEDGFEIVADAGNAECIWRSLLDRGAVPCGLRARDVLRLEAGLPLHGP